MLGRQASEKPQGRKPRAGNVTMVWRAWRYGDLRATEAWMVVLLDEAPRVMWRWRRVRRGSLRRAQCGGMARTAGKDDGGPRAVVVDR